MPGKPITIGPFTGGLNNISLAGEARDSEVVDLINLDVTVDGALTSRPPIEAIAGSTLPTTNTIGWDVLGIYRVTTTEWYLIVSVPKDGTTNTDTTVKAYLNGIVGTGETVTTIKQSVGIANRVVAMVQFKDYLYFNVNTGATDTGFKWRKGDAVGGTAVAAMPRGSVMITWKTRIWVSGTGVAATGDRVWFSTINASGPQPDTWAASDNFDVAPGEGGFITTMLPSFNNLIIFKNDGTWRYSFPADPAKGSVDKISGNVGAAGRNAVVDFENYIYVYDQGRVYELVNSNYTQINRFVKFTEDAFSVDAIAPNVEMSVVNRRLLVRYFNTVYVFTIDSKAWSQWRSYAGTPGEFTELPSDSDSSNASVYIAASRGTQQSGSSNLIKDASFADPAINTARAAAYNAIVSYPGDGAIRIEKGGEASNKPTVILNSDGTATNFDIPVSTSQKFNLSLNVTELDFRTAVPRRTNKTKNPRVGIDLTDISGGGGGGTPTLSRVATGGPTFIPTFARATAGGTYTYIEIRQSGTATNLVTPGLSYASTASMRSNKVGTSVSVFIQWINAGGGVISTDSTLLPVNTINTWESITSDSFIAPPLAVRATTFFRLNGSIVSTNTLDVTAFAFIENSENGTSFFTGVNAPSSVVTYEWTGAVDASTSIERWVADKLNPIITYYGQDGATSTDSTFLITATGIQNKDYTAPAGAILAQVSFYLNANDIGRNATVGSIVFKRNTVTAPFNLMRISDTYPDQSAAVEYIECYFQTKSYDYKAPGNFKRMYWAGMDVKASRAITAEIRPVSRVVPITWGQLESYTWNQLEQGTWGNPLSWLGTSVAEVDLLPEDMMPSENGRYFKKFGNAMRFRQVSYLIRLSTLGNLVTGPVKFFTITTYVNTKQEVVDAST